MATLKRMTIDYQALTLFCVETVLEISNEFISGFKAVIEFAINPSIRIREHRHCTPKQHDLLLLNTNR